MSEDAHIISTYSRSQALADGTLVDVTDAAKEAGWRFPVAVTDAVWQGAVAVPQGLEGVQHERARLWDVLWMASLAARRSPDGSTRLPFKVSVLTRDQLHQTLSLLADVGPGDGWEPVITIGFPSDF